MIDFLLKISLKIGLVHLIKHIEKIMISDFNTHRAQSLFGDFGPLVTEVRLCYDVIAEKNPNPPPTSMDYEIC